MFNLISRRKVATLALGLVLMSSAASSAIAADIIKPGSGCTIGVILPWFGDICV